MKMKGVQCNGQIGIPKTGGGFVKIVFAMVVIIKWLLFKELIEIL